MSRRSTLGAALCLGAAGLAALGNLAARADDASGGMQQELQLLQKQNALLQDQLRRQQTLIDALTRKVDQIQQTNSLQSRELQDLSSGPGEMNPPPSPAYALLGKVNLSGEGGVAFFNSGSQGFAPHSEFRLDEARLFLDAQVSDNIYFYGEVDMATREEPDLEFRLGECYVEFENVSRLWNQDGMASVRAGRMFVPFGEEYESRFAMENPLISHSLSDLWGVDEGLEIYGRLGKFRYVAAVQNGGIDDTADFTSDKSVAGRIEFEPASWLRLSASGMRTGALDAGNDHLSALWFGNGFFRSLGGPGTTRFQADLAQGDAEIKLPRGRLHAFGGYIHYEDNDPAADNQRDVYYYALEGVHNLAGKLYGAVRFSQIFAHHGFPIVGDSTMDEYLFGPLTEQIWRLSLGLGYRWSPNVLFKGEYTFEQGTQVQGISRNHENLFALEAAFKF